MQVYLNISKIDKRLHILTGRQMSETNTDPQIWGM